MPLKAWVNPLAFLDVELLHGSDEVPEPDAESILRFLCQPETPSDTADLVRRYQEISRESYRLSVAPAEQRILDKLVWPLRHAKASYMLGNYLSVIALCGMVAEMIAILHWKMAEAQLNGRPIDEAAQKDLFGRTFENLGQAHRIQVLSAFGLVNADTMNQFKTIKNIRRKYLHLWSQDHESLPTDAVASCQAAVGLVVGTIGQDFRDGKVVLDKRLVKYLEQNGVYTPREETEV